MHNRSSASVRIFWPRYNREQLIARLRERLPALAAALPLRRVVLFGSWAKGRATAFSDVDLLVVYADPPRPDAFQLVHRSLDLPGLEPHVYSESEAGRLQPVLARMTRDGVVLLAEGV